MWGFRSSIPIGFAGYAFDCVCACAQEKEVAPIIADYWEHAAFPYELVPRIAKLNLGGATIKGHG